MLGGVAHSNADDACPTDMGIVVRPQPRLPGTREGKTLHENLPPDVIFYYPPFCVVRTLACDTDSVSAGVNNNKNKLTNRATTA